MDNRRCHLCKKPKLLEDFPKSKRKYTKVKLCSSCLVLWPRLKKYKVPEGYTLPQKCPICQRNFSKTRPYHFDHDHKTGEFRSVLCLQCNSLLAFAGDNLQTLRRAMNYLRRHEQA